MSNKKLFLSLSVATFVLTGCATPALNNAIDVKKPTVVFSSTNLLDITKEKKNYVLMQKIVKTLVSRVDKTPYVFSGSTTHGWDCSGLVRWTYKHFGMEIPHSANKQARSGSRVVSPEIGDLVLFGYKGTNTYFHASIYIGNNKVIHAGFKKGQTTSVLDLDAASVKNTKMKFVRVNLDG